MSIVTGAKYPFRAMRLLLARPDLWHYVIVPAILNIIIAIVLYGTLVFVGLQVIGAWVATLPAWALAFGWLFQAILVIGLLVLIGYLLTRFGVIFGSPWYDRLSVRLEKERTGRPPPDPDSWLGPIGDIARTAVHELKKLTLVIGVGLPLLLLNLVPGIGSILATAGGLTLGSTLACLDFIDPPLDRRRLGFREKLGIIRAGLPATAGFGLVCFGLVSIPLVNLLSIPVCTAAGTLFFSDRLLRNVVPIGEPVEA